MAQCMHTHLIEIDSSGLLRVVFYFPSNVHKQILPFAAHTSTSQGQRSPTSRYKSALSDQLPGATWAFENQKEKNNNLSDFALTPHSQPATCRKDETEVCG